MAQTNPDPAAAYRPEMDQRAHEETYEGFTHFTVIGSLFVLCIVVGLAVGGVKHAWLSAVFMILLAHIATAVGLMSPKVAWRAPGAVLGLLLLMLLLF